MSAPKEPKIHLNVGGPRGWTTACGIESASFVDQHLTDEHDQINCERCLAAIAKATPSDDHAQHGAEVRHG